jgi:prolyl-tRNA editing enzyme YbaK/EbsC (Cys-tRNA(Pro) deacylase)
LAANRAGSQRRFRSRHTAGDAKIDNPKYKARFGAKAKMLSPDEVESLVGHAVGGVCPFALNEGVTVYLDASLKRFRTVFPACGSSNSAIELSIPELEQYSGSVSWIDVCKNWRT